METLHLIYFLAFILIYFMSDALHDVWVKKESDARLKGELGKAKKYSSLWHALDAMIKGGVTVFVLYLMFGIDWWVLILIGLSLAIRWIWFDLWWNIFRGVKWNYIGGTAQTDKLFKNPYYHFGAKGLLLLFMVGIVLLKSNPKILIYFF